MKIDKLKIKYKISKKWISLLIFFCLSFGLVFISSSCLAKKEVINSKNGQLVMENQKISFSEETKLSLGINLSAISEWSGQMPFLDLFKTSKSWITQRGKVWDTKESENLNIDDNGWLKSLSSENNNSQFGSVATTIFKSLPHYPEGKYIVLYDGEGNITYGFDAKKDQTLSKPGRDVINVQPSNLGISLKITNTDPNNTGNYIRNIRIVQAEYEKIYQTEIFNPVFLEKIKSFTTIRFMDWMKTNNSLQGEWEKRPKVEQASYNSKDGVPLEIMIRLANRLQANAWFNMPHMVTDDYMKNFAQMVKDKLSPNLKVFVEYSNEVWNSSFRQSAWVEDQALTEWPNQSLNKLLKRMNWYGKRSAQMCQIWKDVFGTDKNRVVCVIASQAANANTAIQALDCPLWEKSPCLSGIDALAIAPYFGSYIGNKNNLAQIENWTTDELFQEIDQGGVLNEAPPKGAIAQSSQWMKANKDVATQRNLPLITYEGGQHLVAGGPPKETQSIINLFIRANRDQKMYDSYLNYLNEWKNIGEGLFMHFNDISTPSKSGSWGALEYLSQESSPKYQALIDFIEQNSLANKKST